MLSNVGPEQIYRSLRALFIYIYPHTHSCQYGPLFPAGIPPKRASQHGATNIASPIDYVAHNLVTINCINYTNAL